MADKDRWQHVASRDEIKQGEIYATQLGDEPIALTEIEGTIYAIGDTCTHELALLSEGFLEENEIECPLHAARFDFCTGRCLEGPAITDLTIYEVKIEGGDVYVRSAEPKDE